VAFQRPKGKQEVHKIQISLEVGKRPPGVRQIVCFQQSANLLSGPEQK